MTVVAFYSCKVRDWILRTAYFGPPAPHEPGDLRISDDPVAQAEALSFWTGHALVYEPGVMSEPYESSWEAELERFSHAPAEAV
jgi:hypothetical protein